MSPKFYGNIFSSLQKLKMPFLKNFGFLWWVKFCYSEMSALIYNPVQWVFNPRPARLCYAAPGHTHTHTHIYIYIYISPPPRLWRCGPTRAMASSFLRFLDHTQRRVAETSTWQHKTLLPSVGFEPTI